MYVVTNRQVTKRSGLGQFGREPNAKGPNELRLFDVEKESNRWKVKLLGDKLRQPTVTSLIAKHELQIDPAADWYASLKVACEITEQARRQCKHIVIYVHGFNNDMEDVLTTAQTIADTYDVIVVPFSWPANGGGTVSGTLSYKADKRDARASAGALDRMFLKSMQYLTMLSEGMRRRLFKQASARHRHNREQRDALYARLLAEECPYTVNLLVHSMGNYLYKQLLKSTASEADSLLFDNVVMAAADVNNEGHADWLDNIRARKRVYVTINEDDYALRASRAKAGDAQRARLGHVTFGLDSQRATYIDLTDSPGVGKSHSYFIGDPVADNEALKAFFSDALAGAEGESNLTYNPAKNVYRLP